MTQPLNNSSLEIKMWCHFSSEQQVINFTRPPVQRRYFWVEQKEKSLTKQAGPSPHTGSHGIIMTSYRKSMIPLFLPVCSPQQLCVYQNVQWGLLAAKNRKLMTAAQIVSWPLDFFWKIRGHTGIQHHSQHRTHFTINAMFGDRNLWAEIFFSLLLISTYFKETHFELKNEYRVHMS